MHSCSYYTPFGQPTSDDVKNVLEQAATQIASDNTELACAFIQKTATEKSVTEMDKRLAEVCYCLYLHALVQQVFV